VDPTELFLGAEAINARLSEVCFHLLNQPRHADFKKLVEVGSDEGEKLQPLEQRVAFVFRLLQHPPIEGEPAELSIEVSDFGRCRFPAGRRHPAIAQDLATKGKGN